MYSKYNNDLKRCLCPNSHAMGEESNSRSIETLRNRFHELKGTGVGDIQQSSLATSGSKDGGRKAINQILGLASGIWEGIHLPARQGINKQVTKCYHNPWTRAWTFVSRKQPTILIS